MPFSLRDFPSQTAGLSQQASVRRERLRQVPPAQLRNMTRKAREFLDSSGPALAQEAVHDPEAARELSGVLASATFEEPYALCGMVFSWDDPEPSED